MKILRALGLFFNTVPALSESCRCLYGESCWPTVSDFAQLASQVSQPLVQPVPPASACYPVSNPSGNCTAVLQGQFDGNWRANQSGSMQSPNFETYMFPNGTIDACFVNTTLGAPCEQGSVPIVGVDARSASDIQAAVKFAVQHNLRLVVKNTGHDYLGRSTARGSFMVWTHHLKNITYNASFVPEGAPQSEIYNAITLGAGVQWHEAYDAVQVYNRTVVGGASAGGSVGAAGGWLLGGGHSALAPSYGLGVDNVIEFIIVTSSGELLTVNSHLHPNLFWALRGGGGGTYGIVVSATYRTHPSVPLIGVFFLSNSTRNDTTLKLVSEFVRITPSLAEAGWGGYSFMSSDGLQFFFISLNVSWAQANASVDPFFSFAQNLTSEGLEITMNLTAPFDSYHSWYSRLFNTGEQVGGNTELASRLFSGDVMDANHEEIAKALLEIPGASWYIVAGGAVSQVNPDSTGLNPAWRKALVHLVWGEGWPEGTSASEIEALRGALKHDLAKITALAPDSGAYFNEASLYEPNPQYTFFGSHYDKLKAIKDIYDPARLFVVAKGVGSDEWAEGLNCRL